MAMSKATPRRCDAGVAIAAAGSLQPPPSTRLLPLLVLALALSAASRLPVARADAASALDELDRMATEAEYKEDLAGWGGVPPSSDDEDEELRVGGEGGGGGGPDELSEDEEGCLLRDPDGTCRIWSDVPRFENGFGEVEIKWPSCERSPKDDPEGFMEAAAEESQYQRVTYRENLGTGDKCLVLGDALHQCSSYRPQFNEPFAHFGAAYLNRGKASGVRRVLFVGRGDSTLLHEILKYDSVELVAGLELDQTVPRSSFAHLKVSPRFDDPRVQWWFVDGGRSLTLLPRDYFGSFDLIFLGLSENAMGSTVVEGLDVFGLTKLLLSPTGVLVKNGFGYFERLARSMDTCVQLVVPAVPHTCDHELVACGSDRVDLLDPSFGHMRRVETLSYKPQYNVGNHWGPVTDFSKYWGEPRQCRTEDDRLDDNMMEYAGILMVVEAENVSIKIDDVAEVAGKFNDALKSLGYNVLQWTKGPVGKGGGASFVVAMEEGYVLGETWPDAKYCKLDIHLWCNYGKQEDVRKEFLTILGSGDGDWQSYRVLTGGMIGCAARKMDLTTTGPDLTKVDQCEPEEEGSGRSIFPNSSYDDEPTLGPVIEAGLTTIVTAMMRDEDVSHLNAFVFCGPKGEPCRAATNLKQQGFGSLVTLWSCSAEEEQEMNANSYERGQALSHWREAMKGEDLSELSLCGKKTDIALKELAKKMQGINVVVVDAMAPASHVAGSHLFWQRHWQSLEKPFLFLAPILDAMDKERAFFVWSRNNGAEEDPEFYSEIFAGDGSTTMSFGMIHEGTEASLQALIRGWKMLAQEEAVKFADVRRITVRGAIREQMDYNPIRFSWNDYDQRPGLAQFYGQRPVGLQTVFQLRLDPEAKTGLSEASMKKSFKGAVKRMWKGEEVSEAIYEVGDGLLLAALASGGQVTVTWDGDTGINVNIFTYTEKLDHYRGFVSPLTDLLPAMSLVVQEEQPRGYGKVVTKSEQVNYDEGPDCYDHYEKCKALTEKGNCDGGQGAKEWMAVHCRFSCKHCNNENSFDKSEL
ncbi:hypothetical protein ACHAWF_005472 [Thalassiosira exigua]